MELTNNKYLLRFLTGAAFGVYFAAACFQLTEMGLWFDETVEFYYSKVMFGPVPGETTTNMYQRIVSTFQPPLYNLILFFWLKISESEWWFRFFGVVMGFVGMLGLYFTLKKLGSKIFALLSVAAASFVPFWIGYIQECSEYVLMLGFMFWCIYFYLSLADCPSARNMIGFTLSCVLCVYSQYGALFVVAVLAGSVVIQYFYSKKWKNLKTLSIVYGAAFLAAAVPLYLFFLKPQMEHQKLYGKLTHELFPINGALLKDMILNILRVFKSIFAPFGNPWLTAGVKTFILVLGIASLYCLFFSKRKTAKLLLVLNAALWVIYYCAVKLKYYAYGSFGTRYDLFLFPIWTVTICAVWIDFLLDLREGQSGMIKIFLPAFQGAFAILIICYCLNAFGAIKTNQVKQNIAQDVRGVVNKWYDVKGYQLPTVVSPAAKLGFYYYFEHDGRYRQEYDQQIILQESVQIDNLFGGEYPDELYLAGSHKLNMAEESAALFSEMGYECEIILRTTRARLYHIYRK